MGALASGPLRATAALALAAGLMLVDGRGSRAQTASDVPPANCPPEGTAADDPGKALNVYKNRAKAPTDAQLNPVVTIDAMLAPGDDTSRFNQQQGAEVTGYVVKVEQGEHPDSANCGNLSPLYTDTQITVAAGPGGADTQTLIVEVTPVWRAAMRNESIDWSTATLRQTIVGHRVTFRGWLLFDTGHAGEAVNTAPNGPRNWRRTAWEIHPVTSIKIVQ